MKRIRILIILTFMASLNVKAQENKIDCDFNIREAIFYLKGDEIFKKDTLKSIEYLKPCIKNGDTTAKILLSRIYASQNNEENNKKSFKILKELVKEDNAIAAGDLGILYKYGIGCRLNFNKARKWFKKSAKLGNDKASYSLGYLYLKGFGNINQDYNKAIKWFKQSNYPMAKYWLGVCYYYGYGVNQNIEKANELLGTNYKTVISLDQSNTDYITSTGKLPEKHDSQNEIFNDLIDITEENLNGKWSGKLLKLDWSGKKIVRKIDFTLDIKYDSINYNTISIIEINGQKFEQIVNRVDSQIYFDDFNLDLPHNTFSEKIPNKLNYQFLSSSIKLKNLGEFSFLTGNIESYISSWRESGGPIKFVLKKEKNKPQVKEELSDEILTALSEQEENFIKLYPNPFKTDLIISYTLDEPSFVEVRITDINALKNDVIERGKNQKAGKHRYYFNGSNLQKGIYLVNVYVNNKKKTRLIVKK
ncbi:tetratricopeptide repeat protein [Polaribacter sp. BM10]|uniref:tetratricopeptide repeat protein n=1 Tax=Polaribacter sp. BM10 TaxID=1529069 RepID=UPI0011EA5B0A|nr:tetratricopeptide repeat protein [Polaribacter sp. BM10]